MQKPIRALLPLARRAAAAAAASAPPHTNLPYHNLQHGVRSAPWRALCAAPAPKPTANMHAQAQAHITPTAVVDDAEPNKSTTTSKNASASKTETETVATAATAMPTCSPNGLTAVEVYDMSANRATRYVYLRTLPLAKQDALKSTDVTSLASAIEAGTRVVIERHLWRVVDNRAAVHLHTTALAVATQRALTGVRLSTMGPDTGRERVENMVRAGFGAQLVHDPSLTEEENVLNASEDDRLRPDFWIVRMALWFAFDKMGAVAKMTENMVKDFGESFETSGEDTTKGGVRRNVVTVRKCLYNEVCRAEDMAELTRVFCALDRAMYLPLNRSRLGIKFELERTLADEDRDGAGRRCEFKFVQGE